MDLQGEVHAAKIQERTEGMTKLSIFGDSILKGVMFNGSGPKRYSLYESNLAEKLKSEGFFAENRSRMGYTVIDGARDIDEYIANETPGSVLLEYGGNDSMYRWKDISESPSKTHGRVIDIKSFTETYAAIIEKLIAGGFDVTLSTIIPIDPERYINHVSGKLCYENIMKWLGTPERLTRMHDQYNEAIVKLAEKYGCGLIDLRSAFGSRKESENLLCGDGIHPNLQGHKKIEQAVAEFFKTKVALPV